MKVTKPRSGEPIRLIYTGDGLPRYVTTLDAGTHANGKRRQVKARFDSLKAARDHVTKHRADASRGVLLAPDRVTFEDYANEWLDRRSREVRPVTLQTYRSTLKRPIAAFGSKTLRQINRTDVESVVSALADSGKSKRLASMVLFVLRQVFADAIDDKLIAANPARKVKPQGRDAVERTTLTVDEVATLRRHLSGDSYEAAYLLTLYGLRRSEVLALRWTDVDLSDGSLAIERGRVSLNGKVTTITPPKSRRSARSLTLPNDVIVALRRLRKSQLASLGAQHVRSGYLVVDPEGEPMSPVEYSATWRAHCRAAGVAEVTLHCARHSSVTAMIEAGVQDHIVAAWHGHDLATMQSNYLHSRQDALAAAGEALSAAYSGQSVTSA